MKRHSTKRKTGRQIGTSKCLSCCVVCWMNTLTTEFEAMGGLMAPPPHQNICDGNDKDGVYEVLRFQ